MQNINFVAVDFETATTSRMICQIGIVKVVNGVISERLQYLVQPPSNRYDDITIKVHSITPNDTLHAPTFDIIWNKISSILTNTIIVAHNASFDEDALYKNLNYYGILPMGISPFKCTCSLFNRLSLEDLCKGFQMDFSKHHDALFDAECCALFYIKYLNGEKPDISKIPHKRTLSNKKEERLKGDILKKDLRNADPTNPFYDKKVVITGTFTQERKALAFLLKSMGADIDSNISKKTNYVIIGNDPGPKKLEKIEQLIHDGYKIRELYQSDLDAILLGDWENYHVSKDVIKDLDFTIEHYNKHHISFDGNYNIIASKELYYGKGFAGNFDLFSQITGNLGAFGDNAIYPETNIYVLSDNTIEKLKKGTKDDTILYIENFYNKNKSNRFNFCFLSESEVLDYCKLRSELCGDDCTLELYYKYMNSIQKTRTNREQKEMG